MKKRRETRKTEDEERDADWLFFQSFLTDFKTLDRRRKRSHKATFLLLLNKQLDECDKELSVTPVHNGLHPMTVLHSPQVHFFSPH
jgi:hypothetical protein